MNYGRHAFVQKIKEMVLLCDIKVLNINGDERGYHGFKNASMPMLELMLNKPQKIPTFVF